MRNIIISYSLQNANFIKSYGLFEDASSKSLILKLGDEVLFLNWFSGKNN